MAQTTSAHEPSAFVKYRPGIPLAWQPHCTAFHSFRATTSVSTAVSYFGFLNVVPQSCTDDSAFTPFAHHLCTTQAFLPFASLAKVFPINLERANYAMDVRLPGQLFHILLRREWFQMYRIVIWVLQVQALTIVVIKIKYLSSDNIFTFLYPLDMLKSFAGPSSPSRLRFGNSGCTKPWRSCRYYNY